MEIPRSFGKLHQLLAECLEPDHDHAVQKEGHGRGTTHRQANAIGGVFQDPETVWQFSKVHSMAQR